VSGDLDLNATFDWVRLEESGGERARLGLRVEILASLGRTCLGIEGEGGDTERQYAREEAHRKS